MAVVMVKTLALIYSVIQLAGLVERRNLAVCMYATLYWIMTMELEHLFNLLVPCMIGLV